MTKLSPPARDKGKQPNSGADAVDHGEDAAVAAYIADMSAELATLAGRAHLPMLAYFLNLARIEAQIHATSNGKTPKES
jgi:hypothetical protein